MAVDESSCKLILHQEDRKREDNLDTYTQSQGVGNLRENDDRRGIRALISKR